MMNCWMRVSLSLTIVLMNDPGWRLDLSLGRRTMLT